MIFDEDLDPKTKKAKPRGLDDMSVSELKEYVEDMKAEISRVEVEIGKKEKHKVEMEGLFGGSS